MCGFRKCYYIYVVFLEVNFKFLPFWSESLAIPKYYFFSIECDINYPVSTTVHHDDDLDDADCDLGLAEGEVLDVVCCVLLAVGGLVPVLVFDGWVVDVLMFSSTVEAFGALVFGLAVVSFGLGLRLNGVVAGAVPTEGIDLNDVSPSMSTRRVFCPTSDISSQTCDFFSMAPLLRFE